MLKWVFLFGSFFVLFFGWPQAVEARWQDFTPLIILCFVYVLLFTTFFAYGLNAFALQRVAPVTVSAYIYLQPLIAAFIALLLGQETLTVPKILSAVLIFMGVYLVSRESPRIPA
ncbi:MAG: DMT family transporter [Saprospiraceae bacterium]|nr:DMT family transporter [Saprospiraceae bacterium]